MEFADIGGGKGYGFLDVWFQVRMGAVKIFGCCSNFIGCDWSLVKLRSETRKCRIAFRTHRLDDGFYLFKEGPQIAFGAPENRGTFGSSQV